MSEEEINLADSQSMFLNGSQSINVDNENHLLDSGEQPNSPVLVEQPVEDHEEEENSPEPSPAPVQQRNNRRNNRRNRGNNRGNNRLPKYGVV